MPSGSEATRCGTNLPGRRPGPVEGRAQPEAGGPGGVPDCDTLRGDAADRQQHRSRRQHGAPGLDRRGAEGLGREQLERAVVGGAATGLAMIPDDDLKDHFAPGDMWGAWSTPGKYIPYVEAGASGVMFFASRKSTNYGFPSVSYALAQAMIIDTATS